MICVLIDEQELGTFCLKTCVQSSDPFWGALKNSTLKQRGVMAATVGDVGVVKVAQDMPPRDLDICRAVVFNQAVMGSHVQTALRLCLPDFLPR